MPAMSATKETPAQPDAPIESRQRRLSPSGAGSGRDEQVRYSGPPGQHGLVGSRSDPMLCERCGKAEMYRMHAVWRCPDCGYKTDCCGW